MDTSVLVAAFYPDHEHHERSLDLILHYTTAEIGCAAHRVAETYASLTAMPGKNRVSGDEAVLYLQLTDDEYFLVAEEAAALGLSSGAIYDAIIGQCAVKAGAKSIYTWNIKHFVRLGPVIANRVKTP